jgi:tripartite-type tricarboxylate transporter receptor subunit TctC
VTTALRRTLLVAGAIAAESAAAQPTAPIPDGPVTMVVPYTPGTGPDILARMLAPFLQQRLGQPVVVENRPGASGNIGTQSVARAAPDGRTLMLQVTTFAMNPALFRNLAFDPIASFTPIGKLTVGDLALVVHAGVPAETLRALVELARTQPGRLDYASPGIGTPQHLAMELFKLQARIDLNHVPYRGSAPAVQDVLGRRVAAMVMPVHTALPLAADGRIRMLAVGAARRVEAAPEVPTFAEAGVPGVEVDLWYGLLGPAGLPPAFVRRVNADLRDWLALPATREALRTQGMTPEGSTPEAFGALIARDLERWARVVRDARISAD